MSSNAGSIQILTVSQLSRITERPTRIAVIPFHRKNDEYQYFLCTGKAGILTSIGGGVEKTDSNWKDTLLREFKEEINEYITLDLDKLGSCKVVIRGTSWTFFIPALNVNEEFIPNDEIYQVFSFSKLQFFFVIDTTTKGNLPFKCGKFIKDLLTWEQLDEVIQLENTDDFEILPFVQEEKDTSIETFFHRLNENQFFFNGHIMLTKDKNNFYLMDCKRTIYVIEATEENLRKLQISSVDHRKNSIIYGSSKELCEINFAQLAPFRDIIDWTGFNPTNLKIFDTDYAEMLKQDVDAITRLKYLFDQEERIYKQGERKSHGLSDIQKLIMKIIVSWRSSDVETSNQKQQKINEENIRDVVKKERYYISSRMLERLIQLLKDYQFI